MIYQQKKSYTLDLILKILYYVIKQKLKTPLWPQKNQNHISSTDSY